MSEKLDDSDPTLVWNRKEDPLDHSLKIADKLKFPIALLVFSVLVSPVGNFIMVIVKTIIKLFGWVIPGMRIEIWEMFVVLSFGSLGLLALDLVLKRIAKNDKTKKEESKIDKKLNLLDLPKVVVIAIFQSFAGWIIAVKLLGIFSTSLIDLIILTAVGYAGILGFLALFERTGLSEQAKQREKYL